VIHEGNANEDYVEKAYICIIGYNNMNLLLQFGSVFILLSGIALVLNGFSIKSEIKKANILFSFFIFAFLFKISDSLLSAFTHNHSNFLLTIGYIGFMWIGPCYFLMLKFLQKPDLKFSLIDLLHFIPSIVIAAIWLILDALRSNWHVYHFFNRLALLQYFIYVSMTVYIIFKSFDDSVRVKTQFSILHIFLLFHGFIIILSEASGFPEIENTIAYILFLYLAILILYQKGIIFDLTNDKYRNNGLSEIEKNRILAALDELMENEKIFKSNTLTLVKLSKGVDTNAHALSQVINEDLKQTYFEMISSYRINEAKILLSKTEDIKVSEVAYDVGYNSLSAFNTAFKKQTGKTPTKYRDEKTNS
jgi:AraC-like DNA-binding protein